MEAIVEHNEKCQSATAECMSSTNGRRPTHAATFLCDMDKPFTPCPTPPTPRPHTYPHPTTGDLRLREIAKDRAKKLHEVSQRRFKRLEAIEAKKKRVVREQQQQRERDDQARDEKQASLAQLREAREARLEEELAEKTRLMRLRRQASEAARAEKAELHERHRKEVAKQADTSASTRQDELSAQIEVREWRVKRFRHEQVEVLKERTRLYDERKRSKDDKLSQNSDLKLRSMQKQEKRRLEKEKRVEQNLEKKKADHEVCWGWSLLRSSPHPPSRTRCGFASQAKVRSQARKRLRVTEAARTLIEERCDGINILVLLLVSHTLVLE